MATPLPDRSPACDRARQVQNRRSLSVNGRIVSSFSAAWLLACAAPGEEPRQGAETIDAGPAATASQSVNTEATTSALVVSPADSHNEATTSVSTSIAASTNASTANSSSSAGTAASTSAAGLSNAVVPPPTPDIFAPEGSAIPPGSGPLGVEAACNGVDDDKNGVVDDVDATGDGVCDCLKVATLGLHGEWGDGDFVRGWLVKHVTSAAVDLDGELLTAERLAPFHVLLIRDISRNHNATLSFSNQEAAELWTWVRNGGGLMTVIGYSDPDESGNVNTLLEPFGVSYGSEQVVQGMSASVPVTQWFEHPLSAGITEVGADNGYPVVGQGITFAGQDDYELGKALTVGDGHVLVWGDEWITYEDEWSSNTSYQVERFWKNALLWLTRATQCKVNPA
jgi:hypothetical protein